MLLRTVNLPLASSTVYPHTRPTFFYKLHRHRGHVICEASQVWLRLSAESDTNNDMRTCKSAYLVPTYPISPRAMTADLARRACRVSPPLLFFFPSCIAFQTHHSWNTGTANLTAAHEKNDTFIKERLQSSLSTRTKAFQLSDPNLYLSLSFRNFSSQRFCHHDCHLMNERAPLSCRIRFSPKICAICTYIHVEENPVLVSSASSASSPSTIRHKTLSSRTQASRLHLKCHSAEGDSAKHADHCGRASTCTRTRLGLVGAGLGRAGG